MSRLFVPVSGRYDQICDGVPEDLRRMGAERVYIAIEERFPFERGERRTRLLRDLRDKVDFYTREGFETGVWIDTLGYGGVMPSYDVDAAKGYTRIRSIRGEELDDALCPLDPDFTDMMCTLIADIVRESGTRMLMLDDELCLSVRPGIGCACDRHLAEYARMLGERVELSDIPRKVFMGAPSKYRSTWLALMRKTLTDFAGRVRAAVDEVDSTVRVGFCSGYTSWDLEGADAMEIAEILAGETKPFLRFTGAPYWVAMRRFERQSLQSIIECTRFQDEICKGRGIETFSENDSYPRDRFNTPAALSECFDFATRAVLGMDTLKYVYEYSHQPSLERGYIERHMKNAELFKKVRELFDGKRTVGVRVCDTLRKIEGAELPVIEGRAFGANDEIKIENLIFSPAHAILTAHAIPTVYGEGGVTSIIFGESARYVTRDDLARGAILDIKAAKILSERGIDTGLKTLEYSSDIHLERFSGGEDVLLLNSASVARIEIDERCEVLSEFMPFELYCDVRYPAAYRYENADGERFLVFAFSAEDQPDHSSLIRSYPRARQIADGIEYLSGESLPIRCDGHPMLYAIAAEGDGKICAAYVNCHPDAISNAHVTLAHDVCDVEFIGCTGRAISEREVVIDEIPAYGFSVFCANIVDKGDK